MEPKDIDIRHLVRSLLAPGLREHHVLPLVEKMSARSLTATDIDPSPGFQVATVLESARIVAGDYERALSEVEKLRNELAAARMFLLVLCDLNPAGEYRVPN